MRIDGYPESSELAWKANLSKGQNILSLPLIAVDQGTGELIARLDYGETSKVFRVSLVTSPDGASHYQINEIKNIQA
jgi:hypothetical protein